MARGFLAGVIWGTVVSGIGAGALSIAMDPPVSPQAPEVDVSAPEPAPSPDTGEAAEMLTSVQDAPIPETAVPEAPDLMPDETDFGEDVQITPPETPEVADAPQALPLDEASQDGAAPSTAAASAPPPSDPLSGEVLQAPTPETSPENTEARPDTTPDPDVIVLDETAPELLPEPAPEETLASNDAPSEASGPRIGRPAGSLVDRAPAVQQNRLVTISEQEPEAEAADVGSETPNEPSTLADDSPLVVNASRFVPEANVPRMSIVLIDEGMGPMGPAELETFPFPVTFAISPAHPDPAGAAEGYRQRGFEVMVLGDLPDGAQASDVEVTLAGLLDMVPGAVAVLEDPTGGLQDTRETAAQAAAFLGASGHGLVMLPKGMNTAQKLAAKEGVPSVSLFRDLDSEGQDQAVIRRTLDQAAFRARQEGQVVMLGRIRADTVSALLLWGLQDRGNAITLVPISTVLRESLDPA